MAYNITAPVSVTDSSGSSIVVDVDPTGNVTTTSNFAFLRTGTNTMTWAGPLSSTINQSYEIVYPPSAPQIHRGLILGSDASNCAYYELESPNTRVVRHNPAPGQYYSVRQAVADLWPTGNNYFNPTTIWVQPGVFQEANLEPIVLAPGTFVSGFKQGETTLIDHQFIINDSIPSVSGTSGINRCTLQRTSAIANTNAAITINTSNCYQLITDVEFKDWINLFDVQPSVTNNLTRVTQLSTSQSSNVYPQQLVKIGYAANNTGGQFEMNRSQLQLSHTSTVPVCNIYNQTNANANVMGGGLIIRDSTFESNSLVVGSTFASVDSFATCIIKGVTTKNVDTVVKFTGRGAFDTNTCTFLFSDVTAPQATTLISDTGSTATTFASSLPNNRIVVGQMNDVSQIAFSNFVTRTSVPFTDDARCNTYRTLGFSDDFTSNIAPFADTRWRTFSTAGGNINNTLQPTFTNDAFLQGCATFSVTSDGDAVALAKSPTTNGIFLQPITAGQNTFQYLKVSAGVTPVDSVGAGNTTLVVGLGDSDSLVSNAIESFSNNALYFAYSPNTAPSFGINGSNLMCVSTAAGIASVFDSNLTISDSGYYNLSLEKIYNGLDSFVNYWINGEKVVVISNNIPTDSTNVIPYIKLSSTVGAGAWAVDYYSLLLRFNRI